MFVVVGPARLLNVNRRLLNVNRSLDGSIRVELSKMFCERSEPTLYAAPTCTTIEAPVYV